MIPSEKVLADPFVEGIFILRRYKGQEVFVILFFPREELVTL